MSDAVLWSRSRLEGFEPGLDPEQAAERYWANADAAYEQWRDDQILNQIPDDEHSRPT